MYLKLFIQVVCFIGICYFLLSLMKSKQISLSKNFLGQKKIEPKRNKQIYTFNGPLDDKTCDLCKQFIGKKYTDKDLESPQLRDLRKCGIDQTGGLHEGCRCFLIPETFIQNKHSSKS